MPVNAAPWLTKSAGRISKSALFASANRIRAFKLLYLALLRVVAKWETVQHWKQMLNYLDTMCGDRISEVGGLR
jgi:hypothetical protein